MLGSRSCERRAAGGAPPLLSHCCIAVICAPSWLAIRASRAGSCCRGCRGHSAQVAICAIRIPTTTASAMLKISAQLNWLPWCISSRAQQLKYPVLRPLSNPRLRTSTPVTSSAMPSTTQLVEISCNTIAVRMPIKAPPTIWPMLRAGVRSFSFTNNTAITSASPSTWSRPDQKRIPIVRVLASQIRRLLRQRGLREGKATTMALDPIRVGPWHCCSAAAVAGSADWDHAASAAVPSTAWRR